MARHWVDELTVSSGDGPPQDGGAKTVNHVANQVANQTTAGAVVRPADADVAKNGDALPTDETSEGQRDLDVSAPLPGYVCPSSEQKSREFALRRWLHNTSFTVSVKTVPIL